MNIVIHMLLKIKFFKCIGIDFHFDLNFQIQGLWGYLNVVSVLVGRGLKLGL